MISQQKITATLVVFIGTALASAAVWLAFSRGMYPVLGMVVALPVVVFFMNKTRWLYMLVIALFFSGIRVPGVFADFNLHHFSALLFIGLGVLDWLIRKDRPKIHGPTALILILFLVNILILMVFRGTGFRFLGDANWGGMRYVFLFTSGLLFLNATLVTLDEKQWRITIFLLCALGTLPFMAEGLFALTRGAFRWHYVFFEFAGGTALHFENMIGEGAGVGRFQMARLAGESLALFVISFWYSKTMRPSLAALLLLVALALISLSGHRIGIIRVAFFVWIYFYFVLRDRKGFFLAGTAAALLVFLVLVYLLAPMLPLTAQRTVSFLPGIQIDMVAEQSASSTSQWRLNVWREALTEIPDYLLLGKGYTFPANIHEHLRLSGNREYIEFWAIETVAYHNGILSLLIGMGVSGLLLGGSFLALLLFRYYRIATREWRRQDLRSFFLALYSVNAVNILLFFTLYGDVQVSFPRVLFLGFVLEGIWWRERQVEALSQAPAANAASTP